MENDLSWDAKTFWAADTQVSLHINIQICLYSSQGEALGDWFPIEHPTKTDLTSWLHRPILFVSFSLQTVHWLNF